MKEYVISPCRIAEVEHDALEKEVQLAQDEENAVRTKV